MLVVKCIDIKIRLSASCYFLVM